MRARPLSARRRRPRLESFVVALGVLCCLVASHDAARPFERVVMEQDPHERRPDPGWLWDIDVGPRGFPRRTLMGNALGDRRPGVHDGINELTGNMTQKFGPLFLNSLGHQNHEQGDEITSRIMQQRDKALYGSPGIFNLGLYDVFLFDEADDPATEPLTATGYQTDLKLVLEDRTVVTFSPSAGTISRGTPDPNGFRSSPYLQARLDYNYNADVQRLTFEDGKVWEFKRVNSSYGAEPCDFEWNHTLLNAFIWGQDDAMRNYMSQVRAGVNKIYVLMKVTDRYGNETVIKRDYPPIQYEGNATSLCRIRYIAEYSGPAPANFYEDGPAVGNPTLEALTEITYRAIDVDGSTHIMPDELRLFAGTPDQKIYKFAYYEYPKSRLKRPPHLVGFQFGENLANLDDSVVTCFQYFFPYEGSNVGEGILRSIEGPYAPRLREGFAASGYCDPDPPSTVIAGARQPVGPATGYRFDKYGHFRELIKPDGTGLELWFNPSAPEATLSHSWPMVKPRHPGSGSYERDEHTDAPAARMRQLAVELQMETGADGRPQVVRRADNFGRWWSYTRNASGYVTDTDSYDGQHTTFLFEGNDSGSPYAALNRPLVARITDLHGAVTTFRYDAWGRTVFTQGPSTSTGMGPRTERLFHDTGPLMGTLRRVSTYGLDPLGEGELSETIEYYEPFVAGAPTGVPRTMPITVHEVRSTSSPSLGSSPSLTSILMLEPNGRFQSFTNPVGVQERVTYMGARQERFEMGVPGDGMNTIADVVRSASGAPVTVTQGGVTTTTTFNGVGQPVAVAGGTSTLTNAFDQQGRLLAMTGRREGGTTGDQTATVRRDVGNACGYTTGVRSGIGAAPGNGLLQYSLRWPYRDEEGELFCGPAGELPDCPEGTPASAADCPYGGATGLRYMYCTVGGCGHCFIAYSDDRYCDPYYGFCGGSCTSYSNEISDACDPGSYSYIPTCPP